MGRGLPLRGAAGLKGVASPKYKHGYTKTETYNVWQGMHARCRNPNGNNYHNYGGRGISVCSRWSDFCNFLEDMGEKPEGLSIDRINNDGNYEPGNCRWATTGEQRLNQRDVTFVAFNSKTMCVEDWEKTLGFSHGLVRRRLRRGWSIQDALTRPPGNQGRRYA